MIVYHYIDKPVFLRVFCLNLFLMLFLFLFFFLKGTSCTEVDRQRQNGTDIYQF